MEILTESFKRLTKKHRENLKWHLKNKTPIFCGDGAESAFYNPKGKP